MRHFIRIPSRGMERVTDYPLIILSITLALFVFFASYLPQLKVASTVQGLLPEGSEELATFNEMRENYGKSDYVILAVIGKPVLDINYLHTLQDLHETIQRNVPYLDTVESLVNARHIYGVNDEVIIEDLLQHLPENGEDLDWLRSRLDGSQAYYGKLINDREDTSAIFMQLSTHVPYIDTEGQAGYRPILEADVAESLVVLELIKEEYQQRFDTQMVLGGETAMAARMTLAIDQDFKWFIGISIAGACLILGLFFRRVSGVLMPMLSMGICIVISMALLPMLNFSIQLTTSILPSFILTVCVGDSVHLLTSFYRHFDKGLTRRAAVAAALSQCQLPIMMTSLTTTAGLVALAGSAVIPIKTLGIIAGAGCLIAWLISVVVLPALIVSFPLKRRSHAQVLVASEDPLQRFTMGCYRISTTYPRSIVGIASIIIVVFLLSACKLELSNNVRAWFGEKSPIVLAVSQIEDNLSGGTMFEMVVDTDQPQGAYEPALLEAVDAWLTEIEDTTIGDLRVGQANSIIDLLKETNRVLNGSGAEYYAIPDTRGGVAQALLLVEMDRADDLYRFTNETFSTLRILLLTTSAGSRDVLLAHDVIEASFRKHVGYSETLRFTGMAQIMPRMLQELGNTMIYSYLIGVALITLMMIMMLKSVRLGLIAMIPNLLPATLVLGFMYMAEIPLDIFTVVLIPIALGIAVDDTMHFLHGVRHSYEAHGCTSLAIKESFCSVGKALIITTATLCCGFMVYTLSALESMFNFGILLTLSVVSALFADFLLAPALLILLLKDRVTEIDRSEQAQVDGVPSAFKTDLLGAK